MDNNEAACAWSDYRSAYGVSPDPHVAALEHKAFLAGWRAAQGEELQGVQR
jgi:hypothetical protein